MNGHINILRVSSNREDDFIKIQVTDEMSHCPFRRGADD